MPLTGEYEPSPAQWVRDQVALYESSGGAQGNTLRGMPVIILTTVGAKSGKLRKAALMRVEHEGTYAVVASLGGAAHNPVWYRNMIAHPEVELQDGPEARELVRAHRRMGHTLEGCVPSRDAGGRAHGAHRHSRRG